MDDESLLGEECHIIAKSIDGPRGNPDFPEAKLDKYENLILLCRIHHKIIDHQPNKYTVKYLREIKSAHERWVRESLLYHDDSKLYGKKNEYPNGLLNDNNHFTERDVSLKLEERNEKIVTLYMGGDYLQSYLQSELLMNKCIENHDIENASLFLSAMVNIRRSQGQYLEGIKLINKHSENIPFSKLPSEYYLRILKEKLAIAHETNAIDLSLKILKDIDKIDHSLELCPPGDKWLPGIILWRKSHLLQIQKEPKPKEAMSLAFAAIEWFQSIKDKNSSGLASALLNAGWLSYIYGNYDCLEYFALAKQFAINFSPRTYAEANIGEGIAKLKYDRNQWSSGALAVMQSLVKLEQIGCAQKNYSFLREEISPSKILEIEFRKHPDRTFELLFESIRYNLLPINNPMQSKYLLSTILNVDKKNEITKLINKNYS